MKNKTHMINVLFKSLKMIVVVSFVVGIVFVLSSCDDPKETQEQAKNQTATLTNLFGEGFSATVKGTFTSTEWNGVVDKIETALNGGFNSGTGMAGAALKDQFRGTFMENDVQIIIEKNPVVYTKWKTAIGGKILYIAFGALDTDLQGSILAAIKKMAAGQEGLVQVKKQNRERFVGGMLPFELAQVKKNNDIV